MEKLGVAKTLEVISDLTELAVDGIGLAKAASRGALGLPALFAGVVKVASDVKELVSDAPLALPELKDVDQAEAGQLATASYGMVLRVLAAIKAA